MILKKSKTLNAIQVRIDDNVRMLAELHARWEREDEIARKNNIVKVCTDSGGVSPLRSSPAAAFCLLFLDFVFLRRLFSEEPRGLFL